MKLSPPSSQESATLWSWASNVYMMPVATASSDVIEVGIWIYAE